MEISELTYIIRQDIQSLNQQISDLQSFVKQQKSGGASSSKRVGSGQVDEHNNNVVMMLQSRLASMGMGFKDVLELRTQNMKASKDRTEQFMHSTAGAAVPPPPNSELARRYHTTSRLTSAGRQTLFFMAARRLRHQAAAAASLAWRRRLRSCNRSIARAKVERCKTARIPNPLATTWLSI